jgi:2-iminobutanoate/2-iminopropanoate deaminase
MTTEITTPEAPRPGGAYSQAIAVGPYLFTAGMGPHDPRTGEIVGSTIEEQTRQTLKNLEAVVLAAGMSLDNVVKVTAHLRDFKRDFPGYDITYRDFFKHPFPVRTTVGSDIGNILLEVDIVAFRSEDRHD